MSSALYCTRLWWHGHGGAAKLHGCEVRLLEPPVLAGLRLSGVDYVPEIRLQQIQPLASGWRDMLPHEVAAADALLRVLCTPPANAATSP